MDLLYIYIYATGLTVSFRRRPFQRITVRHQTAEAHSGNRADRSHPHIYAQYEVTPDGGGVEDLRRDTKWEGVFVFCAPGREIEGISYG
jgi:hypothetical protein